jgi:enoyl-CoA hydratase
MSTSSPHPSPPPVSTAYDGPDRAVAVVTIDRPDGRNAVDSATAALLAEAIETADADEAVSVIVLTGAGGVFCAGADLKALAEGDRLGSPEEFTDTGRGPMGPTRLRTSKPVIAAIEGPAVAGGLELALWADLRVVASDATLGVYCRRFGVPLIDLGTVRLPRLIGHSRAMDLILTGRGIDGVEAERIGLANRVTSPGDALAAAVALAHELAALPQRCLRNDRLSALEQWDLTEDDAMRNEFARGLETIGSGETLGGAGRFVGGAGRHGAAAGEGHNATIVEL